MLRNYEYKTLQMVVIENYDLFRINQLN